MDLKGAPAFLLLQATIIWRLCPQRVTAPGSEPITPLIARPKGPVVLRVV